MRVVRARGIIGPVEIDHDFAVLGRLGAEEAGRRIGPFAARPIPEGELQRALARLLRLHTYFLPLKLEIHISHDFEDLDIAQNVLDDIDGFQQQRGQRRRETAFTVAELAEDTLGPMRDRFAWTRNFGSTGYQSRPANSLR